MDKNYGQILDVFRPEELDRIIKILSKIPNQIYNDPEIYNNGFTEKNLIYPAIKKLVIDRINEVCPVKIKRVAEGMQLITKRPYGIHTDYLDKGDSGNGTAYLIPLWQNPSNKEKSFTVIFNESYRQSNSLKEYVQTNPSLPENNAEYIWDQIPDHYDKTYAKYLSVAHVSEWHLGSIIYWNRALFHSSDDFRKKGIIEKSALVIFATDDQ